MTSRLLAVHQGAELYGSDRMFARVVSAAAATGSIDVSVVLNGDGPLHDHLLLDGVTVDRSALTVIRRQFTTPVFRSYAALGADVARFVQRLRETDRLYVSTIVLPAPLLANAVAKKPGLVHVHELPHSPIERRAFGALMDRSGLKRIYISEAVRQSFEEVAPSRTGYEVVLNGVPDFAEGPASSTPKGRGLRVLCIGRLLPWKGQRTAIKAVAATSPEQVAELRIVGDAWSMKDRYPTDLVNLTKELGIADRVTFHSFDSDPGHHFDWSDLVVVPSERPEPFGLVAVEAMLKRRPVIAADHGGLSEIVTSETGILVRPCDAAHVATALMTYAANPMLLSLHGDAGRRRSAALFGMETFSRRMVEALGGSGLTHGGARAA